MGNGGSSVPADYFTPRGHAYDPRTTQTSETLYLKKSRRTALRRDFGSNGVAASVVRDGDRLDGCGNHHEVGPFFFPPDHFCSEKAVSEYAYRYRPNSRFCRGEPDASNTPHAEHSSARVLLSLDIVPSSRDPVKLPHISSSALVAAALSLERRDHSFEESPLSSCSSSSLPSATPTVIDGTSTPSSSFVTRAF